MTDALTIAALGLLLGLRHATDADHVVAVTAIVARERTFARAARVGALWGAGHSAALLTLGGALVAFRLALPARVGLGLELGVALMLIAIGYRNVAHSARPHTHEPQPRDGSLRPLLVGTMHGLAGSAAAALLVLATVRDPVWAVAYLAVFGLGTIAGMVGVTACIAAPAVLAGARVVRFQRGVRVAAGVLSVVFGLALARDAVVTRALFGASPVWTPR